MTCQVSFNNSHELFVQNKQTNSFNTGEIWQTYSFISLLLYGNEFDKKKKNVYKIIKKKVSLIFVKA